MTAKTTPAKDTNLSAASQLDAIGDRLHEYQQLTVDWIRGNALELLVAAGVALFIYFALTWLKRFAARRALNSNQPGDVRLIIARTFARTSKFFRAMVAIELVNGYANAPDPLQNTLHALFTVAVVIQVAIWVREIVLGFIERRAADSAHGHDTLSSAMTIIRLLVSFAIFAIAAIFILDNLGVNVTGLVAGLGVGGIAIGLAAQGIFADLFAAISIIFDRPFSRGDTIMYGTTTAKVEKIGMKTTRLRALTGEEKIISNSKLLEMELTNVTTINFRRTVYTLGLVYQTPTEKLRELPDIMKEAVEAEHGQFVRCVFVNFGASSIDFQLAFDLVAPELDDLLHSRHVVGLNIFEALIANGYDLAYPTQTSFTAAPDGSFVLPYAEYEVAVASPRRTTSKSS